MRKCAVCGRDTLNRKLCGDERCTQVNKNNNARKRYSGLSKEQKAKERQRNIIPQHSFSQSVPCKCPRCGKMHTYVFNYGWIGNGTPYKYCTQCYAYVMYKHNEVNVTKVNLRGAYA